jgi:hypothetical protein
MPRPSPFSHDPLCRPKKLVASGSLFGLIVAILMAFSCSAQQTLNITTMAQYDELSPADQHAFYLVQKSILEDSPTNVLGDRVVQVLPHSAIVVDIEFVKEMISSIVFTDTASSVTIPYLVAQNILSGDTVNLSDWKPTGSTTFEAATTLTEGVWLLSLSRYPMPQSLDRFFGAAPPNAIVQSDNEMYVFSFTNVRTTVGQEGSASGDNLGPPGSQRQPATTIHAVIISSAAHPEEVIDTRRGLIHLVGGVVALGKTKSETDSRRLASWPNGLVLTPDPEYLNGSKVPPSTPNLLDVRIRGFKFRASIQLPGKN